MTGDQLPPIKGFIETSLLDWPGQVCAVIFLPYCNLRCPYCHNHRLVLEPDTLETIPPESILDRLSPFKDWVDGLCITGGEPTIHRGLPALLGKIHEAGFKTKIDTNGTQPDVLRHLISEQLVDYVAMDVKGPLDDAMYARCAGVYVPVSIIKESIQVLMSADIPSVFRCTVTPSLLGESDVYILAEELKALRTGDRSEMKTGPSLTLQNFNPADPMESGLKKVKPLTNEALLSMQQGVNRILD
ncbi:MAG: anaerobic ribonucleoside-triphosphate reductase activating protein [Desulfobacteria bacterium]